MLAARLITVALLAVWLLSGVGKLATPRAAQGFLSRVAGRRAIVGAAPDTRYLGLYAQVAAVAAAMVLVGGRYLRVRRTAFIQSARDGVPPGQED